MDRVLSVAGDANHRQGGGVKMRAMALEKQPERRRAAAPRRGEELGVGGEVSIEAREHGSLRREARYRELKRCGTRRESSRAAEFIFEAAGRRPGADGRRPAGRV